MDFARTPRDPTLPPSHPGSFRQSRCPENPMLPNFPRGLLKTAESPLPEPMPLGRAGLSPAERQYRIDTKSYLYCGTLGHFVSYCPLKKTGSPVGTSTLVGHMDNIPASPGHTPFQPFCCGETSPNLSRFSLTLGPTRAFWMLPWGSSLTSPLSPSPFPWTLEGWTGAL